MLCFVGKEPSFVIFLREPIEIQNISRRYVSLTGQTFLLYSIVFELLIDLQTSHISKLALLQDMYIRTLSKGKKPSALYALGLKILLYVPRVCHCFSVGTLKLELFWKLPISSFCWWKIDVEVSD